MRGRGGGENWVRLGGLRETVVRDVDIRHLHFCGFFFDLMLSLGTTSGEGGALLGVSFVDAVPMAQRVSVVPTLVGGDVVYVYVAEETSVCDPCFFCSPAFYRVRLF